MVLEGEVDHIVCGPARRLEQCATVVGALRQGEENQALKENSDRKVLGLRGTLHLVAG